MVGSPTLNHVWNYCANCKLPLTVSALVVDLLCGLLQLLHLPVLGAEAPATSVAQQYAVKQVTTHVLAIVLLGTVAPVKDGCGWTGTDRNSLFFAIYSAWAHSGFQPMAPVVCQAISGGTPNLGRVTTSKRYMVQGTTYQSVIFLLQKWYSRYSYLV